VHTYDIRAVDILEPTKLVIGHDHTGVGAGWFLKKVVVMCGHEQELDEPEIPRHTFPCNRWLAYALDLGYCLQIVANVDVCVCV